MNFKINKNTIEIWHEGILMDQIKDEHEIKELITQLQMFIERPKEVYFLWKGDRGTIISDLTTEANLPSIIFDGYKREKFKPISIGFYKDKNGIFYEA